MTRLPIVNPEVFHGLNASQPDIREVIKNIALTNPEIMVFLKYVEKIVGTEAVESCALLYLVLDTQAECDELAD